MPNGQDADIGGERAGLQDKRYLDQILADFALRGGCAGVGYTRGAVTRHEFDEEVDADEGCEDAAWVDGREPGDVVEEACEDEVVCAGPDGACRYVS